MTSVVRAGLAVGIPGHLSIVLHCVPRTKRAARRNLSATIEAARGEACPQKVALAYLQCTHGERRERSFVWTFVRDAKINPYHLG